MTTQKRLQLIKNHLENLDIKSSDSKIARLVGVNHSTVSRWRRGETEARGHDKEALLLLCRIATKADLGFSDAKKILAKLDDTEGLPLLSLGLEGVAIAAGLGWAVGVTNGS